MDINTLFTEDGMRHYTAEQRDTFMNDAQQIRQMQQIIQARLAQITVDGDRPGAAGRRARKMAKKVGKMAGLLEKAAAQCEAINAAYVHDVLELPDRRVKAVEAKASRRQRLGIAAGSAEAAVAKSLTNSVQGFTGTGHPGNPQVTPAQKAPQYVPKMPFQYAPAGSQTEPIGNILDQFPEAL